MDNPSPKFSILMPVYNGMPFLSEAVASVLNQSFDNFELVVGDDGSSDDSRALMEQFKDSRIRVLGPTRLGLFGNLNRLLAAARGEFVRILCQDDVLDDRCLEHEQYFLASYPKVAFAYCKNFQWDERGRKEPQGQAGDLPEVLPSGLALQHFFYHGCIPSNLSTVCGRTALWRKAGGFDSRLRVSGDYEFWSRLAGQHAVGVVPLRLVALRAHVGRLSRAPDSLPAFVRENRQVRLRLWKQLPAHVRPLAWAYEIRRHRVLEFHMALRLFAAGHWEEARSIYRQFGWEGALSAWVFWLLSLNNRLWRPMVPWILPEQTLEKVIQTEPVGEVS